MYHLAEFEIEHGFLEEVAANRSFWNAQIHTALHALLRRACDITQPIDDQLKAFREFKQAIAAPETKRGRVVRPGDDEEVSLAR